MRNQLVVLMTCLGLLAASGCQNTAQLESKVAEFKKSVESRMDATDKKLAKFDSLINDSEELKQQWVSFQQSYSPEIRQELQKNLDDVSQISKSMMEIESTTANLLEQLKQMEAESRQFRDQTEQHSIRAKDLDKIGEIEETLSSIKSKLSKLEGDVGRATQDAARAERKARDAEHEARRKF